MQLSETHPIIIKRQSTPTSLDVLVSLAHSCPVSVCFVRWVKDPTKEWVNPTKEEEVNPTKEERQGVQVAAPSLASPSCLKAREDLPGQFSIMKS